jgi:hypothetical protein
VIFSSSSKSVPTEVILLSVYLSLCLSLNFLQNFFSYSVFSFILLKMSSAPLVHVSVSLSMLTLTKI